MKVLWVGLNAKYIHSSLALYSIQAACQKNGYETRVLEYTVNQEFFHILGAVAGYRPSVVGIACYIWNREMSLKLAAALKKVLPSLVILLGGPEAGGDATTILRDHPSVDFVVQGDGEEIIPEFLSRFLNGEDCSAISGLAVRRAGRIELNGGARLVNELSGLAFAYRSEMMPELANRIIYYESSRGCPYSCSYCVSSTVNGVRYRSLDKVKEELGFFLKQGVKQVKFVDRTFNIRPEHYREIWRFLLENPGTTNFHFEIVADRLSDDDLDWLKQVPPGRFQFEIGVQSTYGPTLSAIGRHNDWDRLAANVTALRQAGNIHLHLDLIVGLPYETWGQFRQSFNAVYDLQPDLLQIGFLKLLPGTGIRKEAARYGMVCLDHPPYELLFNQVLPYKEVRRLKLLEEFFNQTYNSGRFQHTLGHFVRAFGGDAFAFYSELSDWCEKNALYGKPHSPERILSMLSQFAGCISPELQSSIGDLLKFDTLLDTTGTLKGDPLQWNGARWGEVKSAFWRDEPFLERYIPGYRFTNWREVKKNYPMEVFLSGSPLPVAADCKRNRQPTLVLFDKTLPRPKWHVLPVESPGMEAGE